MKYFALPFCLLMLLLSACEREDRFGSGLPVIFQIDQLLLRGGDTITITGDNFSENAANNRVTFNGIQALIVSSSFRDLVVVVPERAGAGRLVVSTRAGRSNEFPYRYKYQVSGFSPLELGIGGETDLFRLKIYNERLFITGYDFAQNTSKIYRFTLEGALAQEQSNPFQASNYTIEAFASDRQGNLVVSAFDNTAFFSGLYQVDFAQNTLNRIGASEDLRVISSNSDIAFDNEGFLYYIRDLSNFDAAFIARSPQGMERVITSLNSSASMGTLEVASTKEMLFSFFFGGIFSINQQGQFALLVDADALGGNGSEATAYFAFREPTNEIFIALENRIFIFNKLTRSIENMIVLSGAIRSIALSEDGRLFALTNFSTVIEISYK